MHNFRVYWISLYVFRTVFPPIIRSSRLYIQLQVYVIQVRWLLASRHEMQSLVPVCKQSSNLYDIYLMYVQSWTPDDGRKDLPKHVKWYSISSKFVHLVGFYYRNTSEGILTVWASKKYETRRLNYPRISSEELQAMYCTYNVTMRRVRATIVAVEQQKLLPILSMCL
jgi:hypothetical protein